MPVLLLNMRDYCFCGLKEVLAPGYQNTLYKCLGKLRQYSMSLEVVCVHGQPLLLTSNVVLHLP